MDFARWLLRFAVDARKPAKLATGTALAGWPFGSQASPCLAGMDRKSPMPAIQGSLSLPANKLHAAQKCIKVYSKNIFHNLSKNFSAWHGALAAGRAALKIFEGVRGNFL